MVIQAFKVVDFWHQSKARILVLVSNLIAILPHFRDIRAFVRRKPLFRTTPLFRPKFWGVPLGVDP